MKSIQVLCAVMALWKLLEIVISPYIWRVAVQNWENRPRTKIRLVTIASLIYVVSTTLVLGCISTLGNRRDKYSIVIPIC